jgi:hypothetical protein
MFVMDMFGLVRTTSFRFPNTSATAQATDVDSGWPILDVSRVQQYSSDYDFAREFHEHRS